MLCYNQGMKFLKTIYQFFYCEWNCVIPCPLGGTMWWHSERCRYYDGDA